MTIASIGAYDRFNYGDLLFPHAINVVAAELGIDVIHAAPSARSMESVGGVPTIRTTDLNPAAGKISYVLGGGETVAARWNEQLISATDPPWDKALLAVRRVVGAALLDRVAARARRSTWPLPYLPSIRSCDRLVANAVGSTSLSALPSELRDQVRTSLTAAQYLVVRDEASRQALRRLGVDCSLAPDSAANLGEFLGITPSYDPGGPIAIQMSAPWWRQNRGAMVPAVARVAKHREIILLPVGLAGGHADQSALQQLCSELDRAGTPGVRVIAVDSIAAIATAIARASAFVGSSLHGAITAMAAGVPCVTLNGYSKVAAYIETWGGGLTPHGVRAQDMPAALELALGASPARLAERAVFLADTAKRSTSRVLEEAAR